MANRTRAQRAAHKRRAIKRVTDTGDTQQSVPTDTTDDQQGVRGLLCDPHRIRSDLQLIEKYGDDFTPEEMTAIRRRLGEIIMTGGDREAIRAMQVELMRVKLIHEMQTEQRPPAAQHLHGHVHVSSPAEAQPGRTDVFAVAKSLGIEIDIRDDVEESKDSGNVVDGEVGQGPDKSAPKG